MEIVEFESLLPIQSEDKRFQTLQSHILYSPFSQKERVGRLTVVCLIIYSFFLQGSDLGSWVEKGLFLDFFDEAVFCRRDSGCDLRSHI